MTVNRTTLLDLPLPVTGTESGTWGDTTNNGLTQYMDIAIAGMSNLTSANFTTGALTIETTEGNSSATNITATSGQYAGFRVTSLAQNSTITVGNTGTNPARSYRLINADATYTLTFKATGQTGITLQPGQTAVVAFNGTDYVIVGMAGAGTVTDNAVVRFDGTTGKLVQNSVVTIADSTGDVAGVGALTASGNLTLSGGTANGVLYLNGSKVATSGSALTYDGTTFKSVGATPYFRAENTAGTIASYVSIDGFYTAGSDIYTYAGVGYNHRFYVNGSEKMRLASATGGVGALGIGYTNLTSVGDSGLAVLGNVGIGTSSPSQKFEVYKGAGDTLVYGSNPRLALTVPTGQNGLRVTADTTPLELLHLTDGSQVSVSGTMNMAVNAANATAGSTFKSSPTIAFLSKYWNGAASVSQFQGFIGVTATAATSTGGYFGLGVGSADALRIDSSGNLGLGVTPSASWSGQSAFQVNARSAFAGSSNFTAVATNAIATSNGWAANYLANGFAALYTQGVSNGIHAWFTAPSGTAGNAISFTQVMTLDASGRLGIGTTSPNRLLSLYDTQPVFQITNVASGNTQGTIQYQASGSTDFILDNQGSGSGGNIIFMQAGSERARITSGGNLLVGETSDYLSTRLLVDSASTDNSTNALTLRNSGNTELFRVRSDGYIYAGFYAQTTANAANVNIAAGGDLLRSTSALKYKQDIRDLESIDITKFRPVRYKSKCLGDDQTKDHFGIIADEVAAAGIEELVTRGADGEVEGFQYERLTVVLLKELQSLRARVAQLEGA